MELFFYFAHIIGITICIIGMSLVSLFFIYIFILSLLFLIDILGGGK